MMMNREWISQYLESKRFAWAARTLLNEGYRLRGMAEQLETLEPVQLWEHLLANLSPYSRVTTWVRVTDFAEWSIQQGLMAGPNRYAEFRARNAKAFKNVYTPKLPKISFQEAEARIMTLEDEDVRDKALQLLRGGLRYTESLSVNDGRVVGKGGKVRDVYVGATNYKRSYATLQRRLREIGLTAHTLRKLCASQLARDGMREADLCEAFGWASFQTAKIYLAPMEKEQMRRKFRAIQGGKEDAEKQVS